MPDDYAGSVDSRDSLQTKARRSIFADLLDQQLPPNTLILEAGCGTGQLSNFLGMHSQRRVIGADMCMNSLRLAKGFRNKFVIVNADFLQMNLFRPPFVDGTFDVIISNGVLHHTADPLTGFCSLAAKLKPGGLFVVGLYNQLGRLPTIWRRRIIEMFGDRLAILDGRLRGKELNKVFAAVGLVEFEPVLVVKPELGILVFFVHDAVADHQHFNFRAHKARKSITWTTNDRFPTDIKARIDEYRTAGQLFERGNQSMITRISIGMDRLDARRVVHMRHRRDIRA